MLNTLLLAVAIVAAPDTSKHAFFTASLGFVKTDGNTDLTSVTLGNKLVIVSGAWKLTQTSGMIYARNSDTVTADQLQGSLRGDRALSARIGFYALAEAERNKFAGFRSRVVPSFGVSALVAAASHDSLRMELGGGYLIEKAVPPGLDRSYASGRIAAVYRHRMGEKSAIEQSLEFLPNLQTSADYRVASTTSVTAPISSRIAMKAAYVIRYEGVPQPGFKKTDTMLTTGIQLTL